MATLFEILFRTWVASEFLLQVVTRTRRGRGKVQDRGSLLVLLAVIFASIWIASWYSAVHGQTMFQSTFGAAHWLRVMALVLMVLGLTVRWIAILTLGRSFSTNVAIRPTQTLYRGGLYHWVRHPSYTGMLLVFAAIGINLRNWVSLAIMLVLPGAALLYRIYVEELALAEAFGENFAKYKKETRRLLPGIY